MRVRWPARRLVLPLALAIVTSAPAGAQAPAGSTDPARYAGAMVSEVALERAGRPLTDPRWLTLVETRPGQPLSLREVRESLLHFFNTGLFENVEVIAAPGVRLTYRLTPVRVITGYTFAGDLGLDEGILRRALRERFGQAPPLARAAAATEVLEALLRDYGYYEARVTPTVDAGAAPETATLRFALAAGRRARLGRVEVTGRPPASPGALLKELDLATGAFIDGPALDRRMQRVRQRLRADGYYEASLVARRTPKPAEDVVDVTIDVQPGPLVSLRFEGDPIPSSRRAELVPVQREATLDEDLLEDSKRRIERFLHDQGHWKATVDYRREANGEGLAIVFVVKAGEVFRVASVEVTGVTALSRADIEELLGVRANDLFVESTLDARTAAIVERYRRSGYRASIDQVVEERTGAPREEAAGGQVNVRLAVTEGVRALVGTVELEGAQAISAAEVLGRLQLRPGVPFYEPLLAADREVVAAAYLDRGFSRIRVDARTTLDAATGRANITFVVVEGEQVLIDRILIVGNRRTSTETIERALTLKAGEPIGLSALVESQRRLRALGLFSRVTITDVGEPGEQQRDVVVTVEEAPPTTIGYGAGVEFGRYLRQSEPDGQATERLEAAGRGFFEIGRRNLWGSNRSVNLFTRVSVRPTTVPDQTTTFGFNEYRVLGTFREPSVLGTPADGRLTGYFEQAVRSSFNFVRRGVQAEMGRRIGDRLNLIGAYSLSEVRLFDERIAEEDQLAIDRLFPEIRLSKFTFASRHDSRDDVLDPTKGMVLGVDADFAARAIGSQVGFAKGFSELFAYRQVTGLRRSVLAGAVRVGLARGFPRSVVRLNEEGDPVIGPDGQPIVDEVSDLPASERFFAGGDTTVRGFARDALGDADTLDPNGFPKGGNGLVIFNVELRTPVWRELGSVVFVDVGNVYSRVGEIDLSALRSSAGFGVRYKSPIGPVRVDFGFKLDRLELVGGQLEPRYVVHFSIGQAF